MKVTSEIEISQSPETVFPWIAEPEKAMQWQKNVKGGEVLLSKSGMVGTTFTEVIEEDGRSLEMTGVITRYVENKNISFHIVSKVHEFDVDYLLENSSGITKVSIEANIRWKFPMNIISVFSGGKIKRKIASELAFELKDLKRLCES